MTLGTISRVTYVGTGSPGPFAIPFKFFDGADLEVIIRGTDGTESTLTETADFTVTGERDASGTLTLTANLLAGELLSIRRDPAPSQTATFRNQSSYFGSSHEDALDRIVMLVQSLQDQADRAVRLSPSYDPATHDVALRPETGKVLAWQSSSLLGNSTLDTSGVALPGEQRTVETLSAMLMNNLGPTKNVLDYANVAFPDDTAAANAAAVAAGLNYVLLFPPGHTFNISSTVTIRGPVMGVGATINFTGTGDALSVGQAWNGVGTPPLIEDQFIHLPRIQNMSKTSASGWGGAGVVGTVGVRFRHVYNSQIVIPRVSGFERGALFYGEHDGCDYNDILIGYLYNNKLNLVADATGDGWCNENNVRMGRLSHDPGEFGHRTGTRQIYIGGSTTSTDILNNWRFRCSLEGDVAEFIVETKGADSLWDWCRWETNTVTPKFLSNGANAINNEIRNGQNSHNLICTAINGAFQPRVSTRDRFSLSGAASYAVLDLVNANSSDSPIVRAYRAGTDLFGAGNDTSWVFELSANRFALKATGDPVNTPRFSVDPATGLLAIREWYKSTKGLTGQSNHNAVANGATFSIINPFRAGMVVVSDSNTGKSATYFCGNGGTTLLAGDAAFFVTTAGVPAAGKYSVYYSGADLRFGNNVGVTADLTFIALEV